MRRLVLLVALVGGLVGGVALLVGASGTAIGSGSRSGPTACAARWRIVASALTVPSLAAVAVVSPRDVWVIGPDGNASKGAPLVVAHWDGSKLRSYRVFPSLPRSSVLSGISAVSSNDVWAVGEAGKNPVAVHWDGHRWQRAQLPSIKDGGLSDVTAVSATDVWAVGNAGSLSGSRSLVMHFNGRRWRVVDMAGVGPRASGLSSIDAASARDVWAAGAKGLDAGASYGWSDLVLHWDGSSWKQVVSHLEEQGTNGAFAQAVDIAPSGEVWTLNEDLGGAVYFVRWNGHTRGASEVYTPADNVGGVDDIAAASRTQVWAVGSRGGDLESPLVVRWDGTSWRPQPTPFDTLKHRYLNAISAVSPTDLWAVGDHLIVRYSCRP